MPIIVTIGTLIPLLQEIGKLWY